MTHKVATGDMHMKESITNTVNNASTQQNEEIPTCAGRKQKIFRKKYKQYEYKLTIDWNQIS